ncbi:alpha/beta hydrolase [Acinetobacter sp. TGL-Y2]|uniref:alpha/beta hydrolase family protein n=1 Tax=Acinetobacter sp. TGL-Y2 TaxID=1407071 RepID=UPI0007A6616B|nr:alpha/beta fold hydrolase [Acinetobacter sp. TGL-Y2]AMW78673.1 alpha/beta hydrolase [Acinetobacter sp. TGL-Y2]
MNRFENITLICADHYPLSARFYPAQAQEPSNAILICPATGITKTFYHALAEWLSSQGHPVLTFDFRGIGDSLHGRLKDSNASIQDWGQLDIPAAIDTLLQKTAKDRVTLIGHSAGGQLLGITPNHTKVEKLIAIAGSTGHIKGLKGRTKTLAPLMFNVIFPMSNIFRGYGATKFLGMGENLPKNVAKQWAQFCSNPGYVTNAIGQSIFEDFHNEVNTPITVLWTSDDEIATEANVKDLLRLYPNANTHMIEVVPKQYEHHSIGHMQMFKKSHQNIWPVIRAQIPVSS